MDVNGWIHLLFTPVFLLLPLALTLLVRKRQDGDLPTYRRRLRWLMAGTTAALGLFFGLRAGAAIEASTHLWPLFFLLWFVLAMPAITAKNPAWGPTNPPVKTTRTASLDSRHEKMQDLRWPRSLAWCTWGLILAAVLLRLARPMDDTEVLRFGIALGAVTLMLVWPPALIPWVARRIHEEPEPLDAGGSQVLRQAYREHRRRRTKGMVLLLLTLTILLGAGMVALAWVPAGTDLDSALGWVLGGGGALVGLAGGVFGTWMSFERARIAGILRDLEAGA